MTQGHMTQGKGMDMEIVSLKRYIKLKTPSRSPDTLHINPSKIAGIAKWPCTLKSVKEVQSTLGILGYHCAFIPGFTNIA